MAQKLWILSTLSSIKIIQEIPSSYEYLDFKRACKYFFLQSWWNTICGCITVEKSFWLHSHSIRGNACVGDLQGTILQKKQFPSDTLCFITFLYEHSTDLSRETAAHLQHSCKTAKKPLLEIQNWSSSDPCFYRGSNRVTCSKGIIAEEKAGISSGSWGGLSICLPSTVHTWREDSVILSWQLIPFS